MMGDTEMDDAGVDERDGGCSPEQKIEDEN